jgi:hypothetical protein
MSAILTYFPLLVTEKGLRDEWLRNEWIVSAGPRTGTVIALAAQARSHGAAET